MSGRRVVVVDLDQTLVRSDTLHEQIVRLIFQEPVLLASLLRALLRGKVATKVFLADHIELNPATLHACEEVLDFLVKEKSRGAYLVLCSAADARVANSLAKHIGIFDEVIATVGPTNLKGRAKADALARRFPQGFIYAGDHVADLEVWAQADGIVLVGASPRVDRAARAIGRPIIAELRSQTTSRKNPVLDWTRALRVHHWSKNVLIFVPLLLAWQLPHQAIWSTIWRTSTPTVSMLRSATGQSLAGHFR